MDINNLKGLMEAYQQVNAPQEVDEAIYSEKGKAKAAEMIAKRSTPSGRAKPGKGANVAHIRQIRGSGRGDFDREGLGGTPMTPTMAKNPIKKKNYTGTGNKAARRAGLTPTREKPNAWKEELDIFDVVLEFLQAEGIAETLEEAEWIMANLLSKDEIDNIVEASCEDDDEKEMKKGKKSKKEEEDEDEEEEELDEALTGERYKKVMKKPGGTAYSRKVSADPAKRATRGGKGGESDFGAGDRGAGNKSRRRRGLPVGDED